MTLTTEQTILDEEQVRRDLIALISAEALPLFGASPRIVKSMAFNWSPSPSDFAEFGDKTKVVVVIGYIAAPHRMSATEIRERLAEMGVEVKGDHDV